MDVTLDLKQLKKLERDLTIFTKFAIDDVSRSALNNTAFRAMQIARANVQRDFINRDKFTVRSILFNKTNARKIDQQETRVGSVQNYMAVQEVGGTKTSDGKTGVPLATSVAAGQARGSQPRLRKPRRANQLKNIQLAGARQRGSTQKQRNFIAIKEAAEDGRKHIYLEFGQTKGIFKVAGGKTRPRIDMIYDLSRKSVRIPPRPWLEPAVDEVLKLGAKIYEDALIFRLNKGGHFMD